MKIKHTLQLQLILCLFQTRGNLNNVKARSIKIKFSTLVKFIYSEKATNFCEISTVDLSYIVTVKSTVDILQNFMAFSEYVHFKGHET